VCVICIAFSLSVNHRNKINDLSFSGEIFNSCGYVSITCYTIMFLIKIQAYLHKLQ